ncbi:adenosylcobinamide-GDP ribazoletransferase [Sphingomonas cavernae]|uniref:Adenosylcobinamide-GDP ribazoletransferase n=1 Tax=Sphingomonas cavernae TaxID=2320861 RepID=A0A418WL25_9SPHN|nr:adenosylcobinamide-GDP ribazoletransferase [Sphingomonas cavernae]RJF90715.1 adenosylcobinamide-GDP ribazoletransferase [Sphingomonas cavernae]
MTGFFIAIGFLTRLPVPQMGAFSIERLAQSMRWFPLVGVLIGVIVAGAAWLGARVDPWTGALAGLIVWVGITGALHIDGLADLTDALGAAHRDRARLLTVMSDPHIGSFGVVAIGLQLIAKLVLLHAVIEKGAWIALALIPFAARIGPLAWAHWLTPLQEGLGAHFTKAIRARDLIGWGAVLAGATVFCPALIAAPLLMAHFGFWLQLRLGGISGDCHGAGIELVETGLLLALILTLL